MRPHSLLSFTGPMPPNLCHHLKPLVFPSSRRRLGVRLSSASAKQHEPLRVLFCGADAFSIYSLRALHKLQQAHPGKIASIDVVCRPDKRVGRGLKKIQEGWYSQRYMYGKSSITNTSPKKSPSNPSQHPSPSPSTKSTLSPPGHHQRPTRRI